MKWLRVAVLAGTAAGWWPSALSATGGASARPAPGAIRYGPPRIVCLLACPQIGESSGLACSHRNPGVFWTHNDSGDGALLYAFNSKGQHLGAYAVAGARNRDWEDLASFSLDGKHYLLIGDTGDNDRQHPFVTLYLVEEPAVDANKPGANGRLQVAQAIHFTYDDGPQDCESVAVDPTRRTVLLVSKRVKRTVYELPLPKPGSAGKLLARSAATLDIAQAVAMDISPDGLRAVVLTYGHAYEYARSPEEKWATAFARPPRRLSMPGRRQGESICYGPDGKTLYLTSEKRPTPLLEVPAVGEDPRAAPAKP